MSNAVFLWWEWLRGLADGAAYNCVYYVQTDDKKASEWAAARWELYDARARMLCVTTNEIVNAEGR